MTIFISFAIGILMGAFGGILMKLGAKSIGPVEVNSLDKAFSFLLHILTNPPLLGGMLLYFLSAVVWAYLLTKLDISFVQPILALTYVVTPILAFWLLQEGVPLMRWVGIAIIIIGVVIVARTATP